MTEGFRTAAHVGYNQRDPAIDLVRVVCVVFVVTVHSLMVGSYTDPAGVVVVENTLTKQSWFGTLSWLGQIMPLFFVVGGFAGITGWRNLRARGGTMGDHLRSRLLRLVRPAIPAFAFIAVGLWAVAPLGIEQSTIDAITQGVAMPLWFLATYLVLQALIPLMSWLHSRAPYWTFLALTGGALAGDWLRMLGGIDGFTVPTMLFIWLGVQQLGFFYADGWFRRRSRGSLVAAAAVSYLAIVPLTASGIYPKDMLSNLNPATICLLLLAVAQTSLLTLLHPLLSALMRGPRARRTVALIGSRAMTVYLWHLPVIIVISGLVIAADWPYPQPGSALWWWMRPANLILIWLVLIPLGAALARFEQPALLLGEGRRRPRDTAILLAVVLGFVPLVAALQSGMNPWIVAGGTLMLMAAATLAAGRRQRPAGVTSYDRPMTEL